MILHKCRPHREREHRTRHGKSRRGLSGGRSPTSHVSLLPAFECSSVSGGLLAELAKEVPTRIEHPPTSAESEAGGLPRSERRPLSSATTEHGSAGWRFRCRSTLLSAWSVIEKEPAERRPSNGIVRLRMAFDELDGIVPVETLNVVRQPVVNVVVEPVIPVSEAAPSLV